MLTSIARDFLGLAGPLSACFFIDVADFNANIGLI
jgi:hypothetical protein